MLEADLFWSFRSPYSYLATKRYRQLHDNFNIDIKFRPVLPLAVRDPEFFELKDPNWIRYTILDVGRLAVYHNLPFGLPEPDPIVQDLETREVAEEQPHIYRLTRLGQAAARKGKGLAFADEVGRLIWGGAKGWNEGDHLAQASARANVDLATIEREVAGDTRMIDAEIEANAAALDAAGHWGVPTLVFDGEPFFGQDRIDVAIWRMEQAGLREA
ncbi:MAG: 2-hydroxychromene-2-carboxylate isomerase [Sphingomonas sp.]|nr:2-hydroxychromene-2-carboxylate isomerase [Sphingomonas sp.]